MEADDVQVMMMMMKYTLLIGAPLFLEGSSVNSADTFP
jgi:hypothetical protein